MTINTNFIKFNHFSLDPFDFERKTQSAPPRLSSSPVGPSKGKAPETAPVPEAEPASAAPKPPRPQNAGRSTQQRLIKQLNDLTIKPNYVRGNKPRLAFTETRKQWFALKNELKQARLDCEWKSFVERATPEQADSDLQKKLKQFIEERAPEPGPLKNKAIGYAERKLYEPQFTVGHRGEGIFSHAGTDLKSEVIRTKKEFFRSVKEITPYVRQHIAQEQGKAYKGGGALGSGVFGSVGIAERLNYGGERFVAEKKFFDAKDGLREYAFTRNVPENRYFSTTRQFAETRHATRLYTDLEIRGNLKSSGVLKIGSSKHLDAAQKEILLRTIARQLVEAVKILHESKLYHQDIKPENILVSKNGNIVLADFGVSSAIDRQVTAGTPAYRPPEADDPMALKSDADKYALGKTLSRFLRGRKPSSAGEKALAEIVAQLRQPDPAMRPSLDDLLASEYLQGETYSGKEMLEKIDRL